MRKVRKLLLYITKIGESVKELENYVELDAKLNSEFHKAIESLRTRLGRLELTMNILSAATILLAVSLIATVIIRR